MIRDRTAELGHRNNFGWSVEDDGEPVPSTWGSGADKDGEALRRKVQEIDTGLASLRGIVADLERKQKVVLGEAVPDDGAKRELQALRERVQATARDIKVKLRMIEPNKGREDGGVGDAFSAPLSSSVHATMQRNQHGRLSRKFVELMRLCNQVQGQYRDQNVERIKRQLKITGVDVTQVSDEELHRMLSSGRTDVFTQNVLIDAQATREGLLSDIKARHDEILRLEASVKALHDICQYIELEVQAQGEKVDSIEAHVNETSVYVEVAKDDAAKAVDYKRRRCKKRFWLVLCLAVLVTILVFFLAPMLGIDLLPAKTE